jgi:hypothetical protein
MFSEFFTGDEFAELSPPRQSSSAWKRQERQTVGAIAYEAWGPIQRTRRRRAHKVEEVRAARNDPFGVVGNGVNQRDQIMPNEKLPTLFLTSVP